MVWFMFDIDTEVLVADLGDELDEVLLRELDLEWCESDLRVERANDLVLEDAIEILVGNDTAPLSRQEAAVQAQDLVQVALVSYHLLGLGGCNDHI